MIGLLTAYRVYISRVLVMNVPDSSLVQIGWTVCPVNKPLFNVLNYKCYDKWQTLQRKEPSCIKNASWGRYNWYCQQMSENQIMSSLRVRQVANFLQWGNPLYPLWHLSHARPITLGLQKHCPPNDSQLVFVDPTPSQWHFNAPLLNRVVIVKAERRQNFEEESFR